MEKWGNNIATNAVKKAQGIITKDKATELVDAVFKKVEELGKKGITVTSEMGEKLAEETAEEVLGKEKANEINRLRERAATGGRPGKIAGWINKKIIGEKANESLGKKASGLFRGNKTAAAITAIAAPTLIGGGIAYGVGHKKKNNK